jgi:hypothetical protein
MANTANTPNAASNPRRTWIWWGAAIGSLVLGFGALATGSITVAPILLVLGYCVLIPIAILK